MLAAAALVTAGTLVALPPASHAAVTGPPPQALIAGRPGAGPASGRSYTEGTIPLGVHYRWDAGRGLDAGFNPGDFVYVTMRDQG
ncbi:hypothetical protein AAH991_03740 [Microbispora sp. ZYX-F-249]|uniref:Uncharacterized protein n=1 Tax=Microbispora maris TaxID=3144104 RepID=A0ABV0AFT7_9ACTN